MLYRLEAGPKPGLEDVQGRKVAERIRAALGLAVGQVRLVKVFTADGLDEAQARRLLEDAVWHDPILQRAALGTLPPLAPLPDWYIEVGFRPGVTDNEGRTARDTAAMVLGIPRESLAVYTALQYRIRNDAAAPLDREQVETIA
ncbi:MAG: phosphoribosylformylglycinamidine synthase, partial [Desulfovibrio sp.]|nr:phosphoribosylformylglycinamidine synthase [Desulfovibrio sp.]